MANYVDLERDSYFVDDGNDSKVIIRDLADIPGGRALDVSAWSADTIKAGHIIKHNTSTGAYAPLGITGSNNDTYDSLGDHEEYAGVLKVSVLKTKAFAAIMTMGEVNVAASPYAVSDTIKAGLPQIKFLY
jgi:hypothetical protein